MKKNWIIIISACLVLVILGAVAAVWFFSPGIRFMGDHAKFNLKEADCYIILGDQVIDRTTITMEGMAVSSGIPQSKAAVLSSRAIRMLFGEM